MIFKSSAVEDNLRHTSGLSALGNEGSNFGGLLHLLAGGRHDGLRVIEHPRDSGWSAAGGAGYRDDVDLVAHPGHLWEFQVLMKTFS